MCGLPFCFLNIFYRTAEVTEIFFDAQLINLSSYDLCTFCILSRQSLPTPWSQILSPTYSFRSFWILASACKSRSIFNYLFWMEWDNFQDSFFFHKGSRTICWKVSLFLIELPWHLCPKITEHKSVALFLNYLVCFIHLYVYPSANITVFWLLDYFSFLVSLEIRLC